MTCTVGGTISGYCANGRIASAPRPINVTKTLSTVAKDRAIDEEVCRSRMSRNFGPSLGRRRRGVMDRAVLRRDLCARCCVHKAVDDDAVVRVEAGADDAQAAAKIARSRRCFGTTVPSGATVMTRCCDWSGTNGGVRHAEEPAPAAPMATLQPGELARRRAKVRIRHGGAGMDRAAATDRARCR